MSWSFVLPTVIYNSFSFIDVYELEHKMILKCSLIETAVDTVPVITDGLAAAWGPWIKVYFPLVLEAAHDILKKQLGWSRRNASICLHRWQAGSNLFLTVSCCWGCPASGSLAFKDSLSQCEKVLLKYNPNYYFLKKYLVLNYGSEQPWERRLPGTQHTARGAAHRSIHS